MVLLAFAQNGQGISHFMFLEFRHSAVLSLRLMCLTAPV